MLSNLLTFSHTQQPITTIVYTHGKMGVNERPFGVQGVVRVGFRSRVSTGE